MGQNFGSGLGGWVEYGVLGKFSLDILRSSCCSLVKAWLNGSASTGWLARCCWLLAEASTQRGSDMNLLTTFPSTCDTAADFWSERSKREGLQKPLFLWSSLRSEIARFVVSQYYSLKASHEVQPTFKRKEVGFTSRREVCKLWTYFKIIMEHKNAGILLQSFLSIFHLDISTIEGRNPSLKLDLQLASHPL